MCAPGALDRVHRQHPVHELGEIAPANSESVLGHDNIAAHGERWRDFVTQHLADRFTKRSDAERPIEVSGFPRRVRTAAKLSPDISPRHAFDVRSRMLSAVECPIWLDQFK
jgi:hypothetical protein